MEIFTCDRESLCLERLDKCDASVEPEFGTNNRGLQSTGFGENNCGG